MENNFDFIVGIDPSWSNFASYTSGGIVHCKKLDKNNKFKSYTIIKELLDFSNPFYVIEGYSFTPNSSSLTAMAELRGLLELFLSETQAKHIFVAPTQLKKFCTGSGRAEKNQIMLNVYKKWGYEAKNSDLADAFVLFKIGECLLGKDTNITTYQEEVLEKLR